MFSDGWLPCSGAGAPFSPFCCPLPNSPCGGSGCSPSAKVGISPLFGGVPSFPPKLPGAELCSLPSVNWNESATVPPETVPSVAVPSSESVPEYVQIGRAHV